MSAVDISAIQEAMKMTALDQHRGYTQDRFAEVKQTQTTQYLPEAAAAGYQIIREPHWNKGMLFFSLSLSLSLSSYWTCLFR